MAVEATPLLRFTAVCDNVLGRVTTATERLRIAGYVLPSVRDQVIAAGLNPDALSNSDSALWALNSIKRLLRNFVRGDVRQRNAAAASATVATNADAAAAAADADLT